MSGPDDDSHFLGGRRVIDLGLEQEAVELCLRQRVGPLGLDRILGCQHDERPGKHQRLSFERDLMLLHDLQQRALGFRRGPVDLIGEQQIREHRPAHDAQFIDTRIEHGVSSDVRWHHVGRELHARVIEGQRLRECANQQCLAESRHALEQHVSGGHQCDDDLIDHGRLADHRATDLLAQPRQQLGCACDRARRFRLCVQDRSR